MLCPHSIDSKHKLVGIGEIWMEFRDQKFKLTFINNSGTLESTWQAVTWKQLQYFGKQLNFAIQIINTHVTIFPHRYKLNRCNSQEWPINFNTDAISTPRGPRPRSAEILLQRLKRDHCELDDKNASYGKQLNILSSSRYDMERNRSFGVSENNLI